MLPLLRKEVINYENHVIDEYKNKIKYLILEKLKSTSKPYIHEHTLLGDNSPKNIARLKIAHFIKQKQMKEGDIAQIIIGNFIGWKDLKVGHSSGLDCKKLDNSIIIEIKNKYNTCNSGSKKSLLDKLAKYKKENPKTRCIWGIINPNPKCKTFRNVIIHNNVEIEKLQGLELLNLIFTLNNINYTSEIIKFVKNIMYN